MKKRSTSHIFAIMITVLAIFATLTKYIHYTQFKPQTCSLIFNSKSLENQNFILGDFIVEWKINGTLLVKSHNDSTRILWKNQPGRSFLAAARAQEKVKEHRGSFFVSDQRYNILRNQSIDTIFFNDQKIFITGFLSDNNKTKVAYQFTFETSDKNRLKFNFWVQNPEYNRTHFIYASEPDEHFFGFGMQFSHFDMKGKRLPIFVSEQGIGRGEQPLTMLVDLVAKSGGDWFTSYAGVPHYLSSKMHSVFLENYEYSVFDMREENLMQIEVFSNQMTGQILNGKTPEQLIDVYTDFAGKMRVLPDWINSGAIIGMQGGTEKVRKIYKQLKDLETPVAGFWLQDWVGQRKTSFGKQLWWNWQLDRNHYQGWNFLLNELEENNVKILTYINPFLVDVSENFNHTQNYFIEAEARGYLIKNPQKQTYLIPNTSFSAGLVDLTNPAAYDWMKTIIKTEMVATGAKGWMADFGEALPYDAGLKCGNPQKIHDKYPEIWAQLNREVLDEIPNGDQYVFFSRSGFTRSPGFSTLFWLGDQMVLWDKHDGIKTAVTGLLSSGISGYAFNHSDIGGYTAITDFPLDHHRTKELLLRWIELNAFTAIFRTHEGNRPDENYQFYNDSLTLKHFSRFAKIYAALAPYRSQLIQQANQTGMPVVRSMFLNYPQDAHTYSIDYQQFMLGTDFVVAPVLDPETEQVKVYLPAGNWKQIWSDKEINSEGEYILAKAPIGTPAVFYKSSPEVDQIVAKIEAIE